MFGDDQEGSFQIYLGDDGDLVVRVAAKTVVLALDEAALEGQRWRSGWQLVVTRVAWHEGEDPLGTITEPGQTVTVTQAHDPFRVRLRLQRRAWTRVLDGNEVTIPIADLAAHRYTRQSTAVVPADDTATLSPYAAPTEREAAPWWELDFDRAFYIPWFRIDLEPLPPDTRLVCSAFGYLTPTGGVPAGSTAITTVGLGSGRMWVTLETPVVARYIRIQAIAPDGELVALAITSCEVLGGSLHDTTLHATMRLAFAIHRDRVLWEDRFEDGRYRPMLRYHEVWERAQALARALAARHERDGVKPVIGLLVVNRVEWVLVELAAIARGYAVVGLAPDDADDRLASVMARAKVTVAIAEDATADRIRVHAPSLATIAISELPAWIERGAALAPIPPLPRSEKDPFAILFTSGSTGAPKGAVRSYEAFHTVVASYSIGHAARHLSFQPFSHLSERMYLPALLFFGSTIAFSKGGAHLLDELAAFEPTTIGSVPRLYEVLHAQYTRRLKQLQREAPSVPRRTHEATALAEARATFGTKLQSVSVGSAPVSREVYAFMKRCFADVWVSEGYGSTEVGSIAFDGVLTKDVEVKLLPLPDAPERLPGDPERGEIWVKTPHPITGYLGDDGALTSPLDADGFFATGDLGERDGDDRVRVIGRVRNTVKLAQGEFVSAERIEAVLGSAPGVDRIYAHVVSGATGIAVVAGGTATLAELRAHGRAGGLAAYELPRDAIIEPELDRALFTASNKIARKAFAERYGARLAPMVAASNAQLDDVPAATADDDLHALVQRIVTEVVGRPSADGVDSLAVAEILAALSDELGRDIPLAWWFEARDLADFAARLGRFAGGSEGATRELASADRTLPLPAATTFVQRDIERVLLTGATGFLGRHLVERLLARGIAVTALVRGDAGRVDPRVHVVAGDLTQLPAIPDDIDAIVHNGAVVSWLSSYQQLRAPNVLATLALLELAAARGIAFHYVSTISTIPVGGGEEAFLGFDAALAGTPYGLSKWVAEALARRARAGGMPVAIYRPAMISAHSTRGTANPDDFVQRYLAGCIELGCYIDRDDAKQDLTPVDFVADAVAALVASHARGSYNLTNIGQSPTFAAIGKALAAAGHAVEPVTYDEFRARLGAKATRLTPLAAFFPPRFSLGTGPWGRSDTLAALAALGVEPPAIDDDVLRVYASSFVSLRARSSI